ncbi:hypothetical protein VTK73DRAFT_4498 [Phialemonium thermophilum]|uniref:ERCC4 domain-containing protein n=1 Tax=Phialemonium thermophilum TaxID=223376 RepID=A0ABR3WT25_9PEZI
MPVEIISLLSSDPISPAELSPRARTLAPNPPAQSRGSLLLQQPDDVSCPARPQEPAIAAPKGPSKSGGAHDFTDKDGRLSSNLLIAASTDCLSDDFLFESPPSKRRRVFADEDAQVVPVSSADALSVLPAELPTKAALVRSFTEDPIELSSSPIPGCKPTGQRPAFLDSSLFATSSPLNKDKIQNPGRDNDSVTQLSEAILDEPRITSSPQQKPRGQRLASAAWDPISSSAPEPLNSDSFDPPGRSFQRSRSDVIILDDSSDADANASEDEEEFPHLANVKLLQRTRAYGTMTRPKVSAKTSKTSSSSRAPKKTQEERVKEKEARELEKERKRLEREQAKQQRALEKQQAAALAEVNKVRTDKKVSTPEMIVHLPLSLEPTVKLQAETLLKDLDVQNQPWDSPVENVVKWSRKVRARFNEELGYWEPIPMRIEPEKHAMVILPATRFVQLIHGEDGGNLEAHVRGMQRHFPGHTFIYLIEGLTPWMRRNRNVRNRRFISAVRNGLSQDTSGLNSTTPGISASSSRPNVNGGSSAAGRGRKKAGNSSAAPAAYIDEDAVEDALLELQVLHGALIHHSTAAVETARQIAVLTQHLSTAPYRRRREEDNAASAAFCMESGQVRAGDGPRDTYVRLLQEVARVTGPVAYGVAAQFPSVRDLVRCFEDRGPLALEDIRRSADREGTLSDKRIGPALSRRLYKVFTGKDERSMDI